MAIFICERNKRGKIKALNNEILSIIDTVAHEINNSLYLKIFSTYTHRERGLAMIKWMGKLFLLQIFMILFLFFIIVDSLELNLKNNAL